MKAYALTDAGIVRRTNQDYIFSSSETVGPLPDLYMVADGMGGHKAGDYASRFMVENLVSYIKAASDRQIVPLLRDGIQEVNRKLFRESQKNGELCGMGTTLVAAVIEDDTLYVANIGDSRLYLVRDHLHQITKDHSYVEELVSRGKIERNSLDYFNKKNIITRAIGISEMIDIDFFEVSLRRGDYVLLCSDGLTNMVGDDEIERIIRTQEALEQKAENLISTANGYGGKDNIAVILIDPQIDEEVGTC